jgi:hypothetical protein
VTSRGSGPLAGRWRIRETDEWDQAAIDLIEPAVIEFASDGTGQFCLVAVRGWLDCRLAERSGRPGVEFTWEGFDEMDPASGRGWAVLLEDGLIEGHLYFHMADDASFRAHALPE